MGDENLLAIDLDVPFQTSSPSLPHENIQVQLMRGFSLFVICYVIIVCSGGVFPAETWHLVCSSVLTVVLPNCTVTLHLKLGGKMCAWKVLL